MRLPVTTLLLRPFLGQCPLRHAPIEEGEHGHLLTLLTSRGLVPRKGLPRSHALQVQMPWLGIFTLAYAASLDKAAVA